MERPMICIYPIVFNVDEMKVGEVKTIKTKSNIKKNYVKFHISMKQMKLVIDIYAFLK